MIIKVKQRGAQASLTTSISFLVVASMMRTDDFSRQHSFGYGSQRDARTRAIGRPRRLSLLVRQEGKLVFLQGAANDAPPEVDCSNKP